MVAVHGSALMRRVAASPMRLVASWRARGPERLFIAPQDIRTTDPTIANDIYAGYFAFGGRIVNAHGRSPFEIESASSQWSRALAGFGWLRHLRAAETALSRANARALVDDFLTHMGKPGPVIAWEPKVAARRLLSWLSQSPIILDGADRDFYRRFMRGLGRHQWFLQRALVEGLTGESRLLVSIALAELHLCAKETPNVQKRSTKSLGDELARQILPDGGHISRNPQVLVDLLLDLLPLRQAYAARGVQAPPQLLNAIDRMMPILRLFRHGDGNLALFNGMGVSAPDLLATLLAYDDARSRAIGNAPHTGYQRLEAEGAVVIVDAGRSPPPLFSLQSHAGCLSFEFSHYDQRIVVNCGAPDAGRAEAREIARMSAAHSTLILEDTSSCRFASHSPMRKWLAGQIFAGPENVSVARRASEEGETLDLSQDGYAARFGLVHERKLSLAPDGTKLSGLDRLCASSKSDETVPDRAYLLRFHIHPGVQLTRIWEGRGVLIDMSDGTSWVFQAGGHDVTIEESIFFAAPNGPRNCEQIVVTARSGEYPQVEWSFEQLPVNTTLESD